MVKQLDVPIRNSSETTINSYDSHVFVVRFVNPKLTFEVEFEKLPEPEVVTVTFSPGLGLIVDQRTKFHDMVDKVDVALQSCLDNATGEIKSDCVAEYVLGDHLRLEASKNHLKKVRDKIAHKLRNYTCGDPNIESTKPFNTHSLYIGNGVGHTKYTVNDIFEHTHSKIWTIEDFVSDEECDILMRHGKPRLTRATVAAADGSNIVSEARKANQAVYNVRSVADPLYSLSNRILAVANKKNNMQLQSDGQESFTIIQYDENDEYA